MPLPRSGAPPLPAATDGAASAEPCSHELCRVATEVDDRQGLSDVGSPLRHVIPTQVHVLLAVVCLQTLNLLPMLLAVQHPAQSAQKADDGQYNGR